MTRPPSLPLARRTPRALYVHVPFCARRCPYCDFATAPLRKDLEDAFLEGLAREAATRLPPWFRPATVYLGGGTPTELTAGGIERLIEILAPFVGAAREVTLEANPRTLLERKLRALHAGLGVTRLSLGAQSATPAVLERLGRVHRPEDTPRAVALARAVGVPAVNLDLIAAVPGQSPADLRHDLRAILDLEPEHVSVYALTFEPGTELDRARLRGEVAPPPDAHQARALDLVRRTLRGAGFAHYEISNFARRGRRSLHNQLYWRNAPYVGLGNGAASHVRGVRATNHREVGDYARAARATGRAIAEVDRLEADAKVCETAYLALRTSRGIRSEEFVRDTGVDPQRRFAEPFARLVEWGLLEVTPRRVRLSGRGVSLADAVAREILCSEDPSASADAPR